MNGVVLRDKDETIQGRARKHKLPVTISQAFDLPWEKTLFVEPGTTVPFDLLNAAWHFLTRWDAAVPLWRYGETAEDVGTAKERKATKDIVRDLRVLLHSTELLFVRRNEAGQALVACWEEELQRGENQRLAFLRAVYQVKPRLCVLPVTWLAEVHRRSNQHLMGRVRSPNAGQPLVALELQPGRFVKVHKGDEERVLAQFEKQQAGRGG